MGLELMLGISNKKEASHGVQIGVKNESEYPHHVLQLGLFNKAGEVKESSSFRGIQLGGINGSELTYGLQGGILNSAVLKGVQCGVLNFSMDARGVQLGGANLNIGDTVKGLQVAVINYCGEHRDYVKGAVYGGQVGGINIAEVCFGSQVGLVNYVKEEMNGLQLGPFNMAGDEFNGVQIGLICYAKEGNYFQLGLLTIRGGERSWYNRVTPLIGFSTNI